jgi:hypothetical protein
LRNELYLLLVAYHLFRRVVAVAATRAGVKPWFKGRCK